MIIKTFAVTLLFSFFIAHSNAQRIFSVFDHETLVGRPSQVSEIVYEVNKNPNKTFRNDTISKQISKFDTAGNITERVSYLATSGKLSPKGTFIYITSKDRNGRKSDVIMKSNDKQVGNYNFNESGHLIESDVTFNKSLYQYDAKGNQILKELYNGTSKSLSKEKYKYNQNGLIVQTDICTGNEKIIATVHYNYARFDKKGNWLKRTLIRTSKGAKNKTTTVEERVISY